MKFIGVDNYSHVIFNDTYFWKSIKVTLWFLVFGTFTQHIMALPLAILLNNKWLKGRNLFKTTYFLPYITSSVAITMIFKFVFSDHTGMVNYVLQLLGQEPKLWLQDKDAMPITIATLINWRYIGWNTVVYLAGLQAIPDSYYEAADMDGAPTIYKHMNITVPLMMPIIFFTMSLSIIYGMQLFDEPFVLSGGYLGFGGPDMCGFTTAYYVMWLLQRAAKLGRGSAVSWVLFAIVLIMTLINRLITNRFRDAEE